MLGTYTGRYSGAWLGGGDVPLTNYINAELIVNCVSAAIMSAFVDHRQPENGPSGGPNWTRGYKAPFDYGQPKKRRGKRDEILFLTV